MIIWNRVTWYSRYLALFFFTLIFPIWTFYLGMKYEEAKIAQRFDTVVIPIVERENNKGTTTQDQIIDSGIKGVVTIGPTCPVETIPPDPKCADKPYAATLQFTNLETNEKKTLKVSENGRFSIDLLPGVYKIENKSTAILPRMQELENIVVEKGEYSEISISFDSGIR